jgi:hypothetical protein
VGVLLQERLRFATEITYVKPEPQIVGPGAARQKQQNREARTESVRIYVVNCRRAEKIHAKSGNCKMWLTVVDRPPKKLAMRILVVLH